MIVWGVCEVRGNLYSPAEGGVFDKFTYISGA